MSWVQRGIQVIRNRIKLTGAVLTWHNSLKAHYVVKYRTQEVLKQFQLAHAQELASTPAVAWPMIIARQQKEIESIRAGKLDIVDRKSWQWPYLPACYDEDTEILTQRGFIPVKKMQDGDIFATRTPDGIFEWQRAYAINSYRYKGKMVAFTGMNVDLLVTPDHRVVIRKREKKERVYIKRFKEKIRLAKDIISDPLMFGVVGNGVSAFRGCYVCDIPLTAKPFSVEESVPEFVEFKTKLKNSQDRSKSVRIDIDTWIAFLALYLAEGSSDGTAVGIEFGKGTEPYKQHFKLIKRLRYLLANDLDKLLSLFPWTNFRIRISCAKNSAIREDVVELVSRIPLRWGTSAKGVGTHSKALWLYLVELGNSYTKYIPDSILRLPNAKLELFLEWLLKTDGYTSTKAEHWEYTTVSKRFANGVMQILVRLGYIVKLREVPQSTGATAYRIHFKRGKYGKVTRIEEIDYDGYVYCPSVENGVVCVKRNGKISWCGNSIQRLSVPILKAVPYNLRRLANTPVPRRAINLIKNAVVAQPWGLRAIDGIDVDDPDEQKDRIKIGEKTLKHPNNTDSFQTYLEQGIEDMLCVGAFVAELRLTVDPQRPLKMWPVNAESIRLFASWSEATPDMPHYCQMTGLKGERGALLFYDDELLYIKDNPSTNNPFGLSKMEVGFQSINHFLGVQDMSGRAGSDQVHKTFLWWEQPQSDSHYQIVRRHIQNELEGQAKISIIGGMKKPDVVDVTPVVEADLLLSWQELLIRMIANAFDMSAMALGIEHDVNRAVGQVLDDKDFRSAVVPMARRIADGLTRRVLHDKLGWYNLEFAFLDLDDPDAETKSQLYARMYSANGLTPNEWRKGMRMQPLDTPFADLTQAEMMLINIEAQALAAEQAAQNNFGRQLAMMQMTQPPPDQQQPATDQKQLPAKNGGSQGGGTGPKITPGTVSRGGQPPSPKPLSLPKFPIAGSIYSAKQLAHMPVNQIADIFYSSGMSPSFVLAEMNSQEPGILEQMDEDVRQFFEEALEREEKEPKRKTPQKLLDKWHADLLKRSRKDNSRSSDFATWLRSKALRNASGKPGANPVTGPMANNPNAGRSGKLNPIKRG